MRLRILPCLLLLCTPFAEAVEQDVHGLIDVRLAMTDGIDSYLAGDYGKFRYDDGNRLALGQGALSYKLSLNDEFSFLAVGNAYAEDGDYSGGLTEAYFSYRGLPSESGYRTKARAGLMYPKVSMTNVLNGWASPYTLTYSAINAWLGEELRHEGVEFSVTRLGRFSGDDGDLEIAVAVFRANDPAGAVLSWHGWTASDRQTLRHEDLALPNSHIGFVPDASEAFLELDDRLGYHVNFQWTLHGRGKLLAGYYDNRGDPRVVEDLQWAWRTRFYHIGVKWRLTDDYELIAQALLGDTLMQNRSGTTDLVNNDYDSAFVMLSKKSGSHRISGRLETFAVTDNDAIAVDNNEEDGKSVTLNYTYRFEKNWFAHTEFNWVDSDRPSRTGLDHPQRLIERQLLLGLRYFI
jgi:hypothetical protein